MSPSNHSVPKLQFVGYCSHVDRMREYSAQTGAFVEVDDSSQADAIVIAERDPATHRSLALPHLEMGRRVFVDKPLAATMGDAQELADSGLVTSFSSLRWSPGLDELRDATALRITGPARASDPGGVIFYAVHAVELAEELLGGDSEVHHIQPSGDGFVVECSFNERLVRLELGPDFDDWELHADLADGARELRITPGPDYYDGAARGVVEFAGGAEPKVGAKGMLSVMRVVAAIHEWAQARESAVR